MTAESQSTLERAFEIRLDDSPFRVLLGEQVRLCGRRDSCPSRPAEPTRLYARHHRAGSPSSWGRAPSRTRLSKT